MIASLVALSASNMPRQTVALHLGLRLLVGAIEVLEREGDIGLEPRSSSTNSGVNVPRSGELKRNDAFDAVAIE